MSGRATGHNRFDNISRKDIWLGPGRKIREQELCGNYTLTFLIVSHILWLKTFPFWNGEITSGEKECKYYSIVKQLSI